MTLRRSSDNSKNRRALDAAFRRINATLTALDQALVSSANDQRQADEFTMRAGINARKELATLERDYTEFARHARAVREEHLATQALSRDWGERADKALASGRPDLADQARQRQRELDISAQHFEHEATAWVDTEHSYVDAIQRLRNQLATEAPVSPG